MATITLKAGMVWRGEYDSAATYNKLDVVKKDYAMYVCTQQNTNIDVTNSNYWEPNFDASSVVALLEEKADEIQSVLDEGNIYTPQVGTVSTGNTSSVSIVNNEQTKKSVFNFVLEKGEKGDKGDKGDRGEKGDTTVIDPSTSTVYTLYNQTGSHTDGAMTQAAVTEEFEKLDETYAHIDGYYESMGVGTASNIKGQNIVDAEFTYRKSGGNVEVQDGNAMIEAIKGNTIAWNQLINDRTSYVDMGLPSGTLWCSFNVGATAPTEDGLYFSWGNTDGHTLSDGYDFGNSNSGVYAQTSGADLTGNIPLNDTYDAACNNKGAIWRLPTANEFTELYSNCTTEWVEQSGVNGLRFTSNINNNTLFFPASGIRLNITSDGYSRYGCYWSSTYLSSSNARAITFNASQVNINYSNSRYFGFSVRSVISSNTVQQGASNKKYLFDKDNLFDLTLIYGSGNEPTTVEQFEQDYFNWVGKPLTYEPYDAGSLRNTKVSALKTVGFNLWDEEWEAGDISTSNGRNIANASTIRSKNFIPVSHGATYYYRGDSISSIFGRMYDSQKNFIVYSDIGLIRKNTTFTIPTECSYIRFVADGTTYNNDICINLSDPNRNGEYEPYWSNTEPINITAITGKLNGAGNSVVVFPDGMKSAGDVHDEICVVDGVTKAIKRVSSSHEVLADPEVYISDNFTLPALYKVASGGTEEQVMPENSIPATLSLRYGLNAAKFIADAPKNYISKESMSNFLGNLGSAMGGTWNMTWNSSTNKYDFSFTQNRSVDVEQPIENR